MRSLPDGYKAVVIGASGGIGAALVDALRADPRCGQVEALHRRSPVPVDFAQPCTVAAAAESVGRDAPFQLVINAAGVLNVDGSMPEKKLADLDDARLLETFRVNTIGPALVLRHFVPLLDRRRSLVGILSAKVGSIGDNRLGGWYGYRASKAAVNMIVRTAAIELARTSPQAVVAALHPGTVDTALSRPFGGARIGRPATSCAAELLAVLDGLRPPDSGCFVAYDGTRLPW